MRVSIAGKARSGRTGKLVHAAGEPASPRHPCSSEVRPPCRGRGAAGGAPRPPGSALRGKREEAPPHSWAPPNAVPRRPRARGPPRHHRTRPGGGALVPEGVPGELHLHPGRGQGAAGARPRPAPAPGAASRHATATLRSAPRSSPPVCPARLQEEFYERPIVVADRELVESSAETILEAAESGDAALLVVGDPFGCAPPPAGRPGSRAQSVSHTAPHPAPRPTQTSSSARARRASAWRPFTTPAS